MRATPVQRFMFTAALTCASRMVQIRDRFLNRVPRSRAEFPGIAATQHTISSGNNRLDAVYVTASPGEARPAVLICHGIGEIVPQWFPIQRIFAENGIASLVFDFSGYGRSTGRPDWSQCEDDAVGSLQPSQGNRAKGPDRDSRILARNRYRARHPRSCQSRPPRPLRGIFVISQSSTRCMGSRIPVSPRSRDLVCGRCSARLHSSHPHRSGRSRSPLPPADGSRSRRLLQRPGRPAHPARPLPQRAFLQPAATLLGTHHLLAAPECDRE